MGQHEPTRRPSTAVLALALALFAGAVACFHALSEQRGRTMPLDLDGWGHLIGRLNTSGHHFSELIREPSLWKGPVVPFLFGLAYYVAPFAESVLYLNAAAFALAAALLFQTLGSLGVGRRSAALAVIFWTLYVPNKIVFGYYLAEPLVSLLSVILLALVSAAVVRKKPALAFAAGLAAGVLLLSRAPFLLTVGGSALLFWFHVGRQRIAFLALYGAGVLLVMLPWIAHNYQATGQFIPFTTEGGKILFQGTYLPGDDVQMDQLRQNAGYAALEAAEPTTAVEQYRYWQALAAAQVKADPLGQLRLVARKTLRFWVYLDAGAWVPHWKSAVVAAVLLPLAVIGAVRGRRELVVQLCVLWVGGLWVFHALVHAELRYNFPVLPYLVVLAGFGFPRLGAGSSPPPRDDRAGAAHTGDPPAVAGRGGQIGPISPSMPTRLVADDGAISPPSAMP